MKPESVQPTPIVLNEYQDTRVDLDPADLTYVEQVLKDRVSVSRPFHADGYLLNPNQFAGIVVLPSGRRIECRPKVPVGNFFVMLAVAFDLDPGFLAETATYQRIDEVFEFVIEYFAELVDRRINRGLYRSYVEREENLRAVRGRIAIGEDIRRNHILRHRTYCRFTDLTWDIPENQIVRQVAHMTAGWVVRPELRDELRRIDRMLAEVAPVTLPASAIDRFTYGRLNDDYRPIHRLCRLFLEGSSVSEDNGVFDFRTFLFDMNVLFERFVTRLLASNAPADLRVEPQSQITLGTLNEVTMRPDITLRRTGQAVAAIDCKYKRLDTGQYKNHDQYQLLAYCTALDVTRGMLVYPRHEQALDEEIRVRNSDVRIRQLSIDLSGDRTAFTATCQDFARRVLSWTDPDERVVSVLPLPPLRRGEGGRGVRGPSRVGGRGRSPNSPPKIVDSNPIPTDTRGRSHSSLPADRVGLRGACVRQSGKGGHRASSLDAVPRRRNPGRARELGRLRPGGHTGRRQ